MTLIKDLELLLKERDMSAEDASRLIGCSLGQIYKWLQGEVQPGSLSTKAIRQALPKIRRIPVADFVGISRDRALYRKLAKMISVEEKGWLLAGGSYDVYRNRLDQLAEKYGMGA
jgi:transcriptional regulator with XRE-family HTH domain